MAMITGTFNQVWKAVYDTRLRIPRKPPDIFEMEERWIYAGDTSTFSEFMNGESQPYVVY